MRYSACKLHVTLASYIIKVAQYPGFLRLTNLEIHAGRLFAFLICQQIVSFGSHQSFTVRILGDFPHVLWVLPSNNQFIIKLVKMWPGGTPLWEYGLALALVTWPNIIIQRAVNWGIQLYEQLKTN